MNILSCKSPREHLDAVAHVADTAGCLLAKNRLPPQLSLILYDVFAKLRSLFATSQFRLFEHVSIETTSRCQRACGYCPHSDLEKKTGKQRRGLDMSDKLFSKIADQLAEIGYRGRISLNGFGEPLQDPKIEDRIKELRLKLPHCRIEFYSNGDDLDKILLRKLIAAGLNCIFVTNHNTDLEERDRHEKRIKEMAGQPDFKKYLHYSSGVRKVRNRGGAVDEKTMDFYRSHGLADTEKSSWTCVAASFTLTISASGNVLGPVHTYFFTMVEQECVWMRGARSAV